MAWNQPGNSNNNPWGKKPAAGGDLDQAFKDWQKRLESLFGGGGGSTMPLLIIVCLIVAGWMMTGFYQVKSAERGVVQRFGAYYETVGDGLGWRFPWPIETVTKVNVEANSTTSSTPRVLTAESTMVELNLGVQYRIKDAEDYLFRVQDPKSTLIEVGESAIREVVGRNNQQAILSENRIRIVQDTVDIMQRTLDQYGTGLEVVNVNIIGAQVPEAVQAAQSDSVKASADRKRMVKEAQAYANNLLPVAEGNAARYVQEAEAYKSQVVSMATGDASRFSQLALAYDKAPAVTRQRLYLETVESVFKSSRKVLIDSKAGNGNMLYLPLDKIMERSRDADANTVTVRPPVTVEGEAPGADTRQRVER
jgi:modulator of FtsH protease HflK